MQFSKRSLAGILLPIFSLTVPSQAAVTKPYIKAEQMENIYRHLVEKHWAPKTGLFISFLDTQDRKLSQQASTYEQATIGMLAVRLGDIERARGIFDFMRHAWDDGPLTPGREGVEGLSNFYNAEFGGAGIEKTIHIGPNAWVGLFAAYYANRTGDAQAIQFPLAMARWMAQQVAHRDGGIAMGPIEGADGIPWPDVYSTENNVSYYAFLAELLRSPHLEQNDMAWLSDEKQRVETWLTTVGYDQLAGDMNRGTNPGGVDRTRALDTITWLISAVGPDRLLMRGIDPRGLMRQAQQAYVVKVDGRWGVDATDQPEADKTFSLTGEDLTAWRGSSRLASDKHRMIWYEGLGQYINALTTMADFADRRGATKSAIGYAERARFFTDQFDAAALKHYPAGTAFAYATYGKFFHDGWYPPRDSDDGAPSSLVAAVWRCFAGLGMDPLAGQVIGGVPPVSAAAPEIARVDHKQPEILFGTSEDMVVQAWHHLEAGRMELAIAQAQATVQEWSPWARQLQEKKAKSGGIVDYFGMAEQRQKIFSYWALNDVAASHYIIGKASDAKHKYAQAAAAFQEIALHYPLAQVWDPRGWFWAPSDAIQEEFVEGNPRRYGHLIPAQVAANQSKLQQF
jgi:hypothetical protein